LCFIENSSAGLHHPGHIHADPALGGTGRRSLWSQLGTLVQIQVELEHVVPPTSRLLENSNPRRSKVGHDLRLNRGRGFDDQLEKAVARA